MKICKKIIGAVLAALMAVSMTSYASEESSTENLASEISMGAESNYENLVLVSEEVFEDGWIIIDEFNECVERIKSVYYALYPEDISIVDEIVDGLASSEVFLGCYDVEGKKAFQIVEDCLRDALEPTVSPYSANGVVYKLKFVPVINQRCYHPGTGEMLNYYCGPASALQALIANGKITAKDNQSPAAVYNAGCQMDIDNNGANITKLNNFIKEYYSSTTITYKTKAFTRFSYDKALDFIIYSLSKGQAPVLRVQNTSRMDYYNGKELQHYVTIAGVDTVNGTITVVDPNYMDEYRGEHVISLDEFNNVMRGDGNFDGWLSVYTNVSEGNYIYG